MNPAPTARTSDSRPKGKFGCGSCLLIVVGLAVLLAIAGYATLFHSSWPLKWVAGSIEDQAPRPTSIQGISGSISKGFSIDEITYEGLDGTSFVKGLTFNYQGVFGMFANNSVVIRELSIDEAELIVGNNFLERNEGPPPRSDTARPTSSAPAGEGSFGIEELTIENTRVRTPDGQLDLQIPRLHLAGLKIGGGNLQLEELELKSNHMELALEDAEPTRVDNQLLPLRQKIAGRILPDIHPSMINGFDFSIEFANRSPATSNRLRAFNNSLEQASLPDGTTLVRLDDFSPDDFFEPGDLLIPDRINVTIRESGGTAEIEAGEFHFGASRFDIAPQVIETEDPAAHLIATSRVDSHDVTATLAPNHQSVWPPFRIELTAEPEMPEPDLLAFLYFQESYDNLPPGDQTRIDTMATPEADVPPQQ